MLPLTSNLILDLVAREMARNTHSILQHRLFGSQSLVQADVYIQLLGDGRLFFLIA